MGGIANLQSFGLLYAGNAFCEVKMKERPKKKKKSVWFLVGTGEKSILLKKISWRITFICYYYFIHCETMLSAVEVLKVLTESEIACIFNLATMIGFIV